MLCILRYNVTMSNPSAKKKRGRGRPKLDEHSKTFRVTFQLTERDMEVLREDAARVQMPLAKYLRTMIRSGGMEAGKE
jgi:hypothetical protein